LLTLRIRLWTRDKRLAAIALIGPDAWVIDDTGFVKDGPASPGVARQYSGTVDKVANVQVVVSVHAAGYRRSSADEAQRGCGVSVHKHVDCATTSRGAGKANVARDQHGAEHLGEHDVARVVRRDALP
jgi:DDE superfamily endonuclease